MNIYETNKYKENRKKYDELLFSKCNFKRAKKIKRLKNGYYIKIYAVKENHQNNSNIENRKGSICILYNEKNEFIYEWKCIYYDSNISDIIHHSNKKDYLIFTEDLYGYSVIELDSLKSIHYIPEESFYPNKEFKETFIWEDIYYNEKNDYLAITGCLWAHPSSIIIVDFKNPLEIQESNKWIDIHKMIDPNYEKYDDIEFIKWNQDEIQIKVENNITEKTETKTISINEIRR